MSSAAHQSEYAGIQNYDEKSHSYPPSPANGTTTEYEAESATIEPADGHKKPVVTRTRFLTIFAGICLATLMGALDNTIVSTAMPAISSQFEAFESISWVATIYLLAATSLQPVVGKFSDIFGRKVVYIGSIIVFLIGSALCGAAQSIGMLIGARAVQGVGAAGLFGISMIIILDLTSVQEASMYTGMLGAIFAVASVAGPLMGGAFTDAGNNGWRWTFFVNLPIGVPTLAVLIWFLQLPVERTSLAQKLKKIDYAGILVFVGGVVCILLATTWGGNQYAWNSGQVIGCYCAGAVLLISFVVIEARFAADPVIPLRLFRSRNFWSSSVVNFGIGFVMFALIFYIPLFFQVARGDTATQSGVRMIPLMVSISIFAVVSGFIVAKYGLYKWQIVIGMVLSTVGTGLLTLWDAEANTAKEVCFLIIIGIGLGFTMQTTITSTQAELELEDQAIGTSLVNFFRTIGGVISVSVMSAIMNNKLATELHQYPDSDLLLAAAKSGADAMKQLAPEQLMMVSDAYVKALHVVFIAHIPFAGLTALFALLVRQIKLQGGAGPAMVH
ncbi:MFS general substrate transporter [Ramicandelaber brevisporus]|nr:MFS general substrate transporter [Ramicandelaber brevisporus]